MLLKDLPKIEAIDKRGSRYYKIDGIKELYPSITTVTGSVLAKPGLVPWAKKIAIESMTEAIVEAFDKNNGGIEFADEGLLRDWLFEVAEVAKKRPDQIKDAAGDIGKRIHAAIESTIKGESVTVTDDVKIGLDAYISWQKDCKLKIIASELSVFSEELRSAGTIDALAENEWGEYELPDWKTSKGIYDSMAFQLGGYSKCLAHCMGIKIKIARIVKFPKYAGDVTVQKKIKDIQSAEDGFVELRNLFDRLKTGMYEKE